MTAEYGKIIKETGLGGNRKDCRRVGEGLRLMLGLVREDKIN